MPEDQDPRETQEWRERSTPLWSSTGSDRAAFLLEQLHDEARRHAVPVPFTANTPYLNTIPVDKQPPHPGDLAIEHRIRSLNRWNAVATVLKANKESSELGGHIASFQSSATLYDTGFNHFWHAPSAEHGGDLLFVQGHVAPGIYARSFLEGRLTEEQLLGFRQEVGGRRAVVVPAPVADAGLLAVPHGVDGPGPADVDLPGPVPQVPATRAAWPTRRTGTCGRSSATARWTSPSRWARSALASREKLDNLIFVINCNLQRLDGPVRGNGKIIQELEGIFRGAGWNVLKVDLGIGLGPAAGRGQVRAAAQAHGGVRRRRVPGLQVQERRVRPRALLRQVPRAARPGQGHDRRPDLGAVPRRARPVEGLRGLQGGGGQRRHADGDPGQDRQGLRDG